jgi:hypothetical protein
MAASGKKDENDEGVGPSRRGCGVDQNTPSKENKSSITCGARRA